MIQATPTADIRNYLELGFDSQLQKMPAERSDHAFKGGDYYGSLEVDGMLESVDIGKLISNSLRSTMKVGRIIIDGVAGELRFYDKSNRQTGVIGGD